MAELQLRRSSLLDWKTVLVNRGLYCCFVTISTIGFGDVVPGSSKFDTTIGQLKMLVAAVYMVFGMALLSMAFNLIQEEMVGKFKWLGVKCGIIKNDEDEDDDDDDVGPTPPADTRGAPARQPAPPPDYFNPAHKDK